MPESFQPRSKRGDDRGNLIQSISGVVDIIWKRPFSVVPVIHISDRIVPNELLQKCLRVGQDAVPLVDALDEKYCSPKGECRAHKEAVDACRLGIASRVKMNEL